MCFSNRSVMRSVDPAVANKTDKEPLSEGENQCEAEAIVLLWWLSVVEAMVAAAKDSRHSPCSSATDKSRNN